MEGERSSSGLRKCISTLVQVQVQVQVRQILVDEWVVDTPLGAGISLPFVGGGFSVGRREGRGGVGVGNCLERDGLYGFWVISFSGGCAALSRRFMMLCSPNTTFKHRIVLTLNLNVLVASLPFSAFVASWISRHG